MTDISELSRPYADYFMSIRSVWGNGTDPDLPIKVRKFMTRLFEAAGPDGHWWIREMIEGRETAREFYRDPDYGFIQMGHVDPKGHYVRPHDHGPCWVVYGCIRGATDIMLYESPDMSKRANTKITLQKKELHHLTPGVVYAYLPGDIHSTVAVEGPSVVFRFLSADLRTVKRTRFDLEKGSFTFGY